MANPHVPPVAVTLVLTPADAPAAVALIRELDADILGRDPGGPIHGLHPGEARDPRLRFFVLTVDGQPVGCGALRRLEPKTAELKRMFVRPAFRGKGLARVLLDQLENEARAAGIRILRLETGPRQVEALALYRTSGYAGIPRYGEYTESPDSICMEKLL
jgi:GNAT superfamily N-acetyltransferase